MKVHVGTAASAVRRAKPGNAVARSQPLEADFMPDTILVVVEQREGKLNRVSWETITAGQAIAAATGWTLEAAVVGGTLRPLRRRSRRQEGREGLRGRIAEARALHARRLRRRAQATPHHEAAQARPDAAHLSGARLRPQAGHCHGTRRHQRLHRLQARKRQAGLYPSDVSGQVRRRRQLHLRRSVVRHLPERRVSRRQSRSRREPAPG